MRGQCVQGWRGSVKVGAGNLTDLAFLSYTTLPVTKWQVILTTDLADVTAGTEIIKQYVPGYTDVEVGFDCLWFGGLAAFGDQSNNLNLSSGSTVKLKLYLDAAEANDVSAFILPQVLISSVNMESGVRDVVKYTVKGKLSSSVAADLGTEKFTYPSI